MPSRATKRTKLDSPAVPATKTSTSAEVEGKHRIFTHWSQARGVQINGVAPSQLPGRGLGLLTTRSIKAGERMLFIPEKAMFKPNTKFLKQHRLDRASPHAQLAISATAVYRAPDTSLACWEATWPTREDFWASLPLCWTDAERTDLPPSVLHPLERQLDDYRKDWAAVRDVCEAEGWDEEEFRYYWMIVNSRSFHWKPPRGRAGVMVMCPFIDYINHGPTGTTCRVTTDQRGYEVHADRDYAPGEEILATYGAHSNDTLLVHYGFLLPTNHSNPNPDDSIPLDNILLPHLPNATQSKLRDLGYLGAYALLPAPVNDICFKTSVAVRAELLSCNEWEYFMTNGEDLGSDQSGAVREFLLPVLREYWEECGVRMRELEAAGDGERGMKAALARSRWLQVREALEAYIEGGERG